VLTGLFATWFADHTAEEITAALSDTTVLFERYRTFSEVASDKRVTDNSLFSRLDQPGVGEYLAPGMPFELDGAHLTCAAAPGLGRDTAGLLAATLGLTSDDVGRLVAAGTIGCAEGEH